jgi:hypothetical protein
VWGDGLVSVTTTPGEVSVVCPAGRAPAEAEVEPGWRAYTVDGPLDFALTGILADLTATLATAGVPVFAVSTYDTDHLLVRVADCPAAEQAWTAAGHRVR